MKIRIKTGVKILVLSPKSARLSEPEKAVLQSYNEVASFALDQDGEEIVSSDNWKRIVECFEFVGRGKVL